MGVKELEIHLEKYSIITGTCGEVDVDKLITFPVMWKGPSNIIYKDVLKIYFEFPELNKLYGKECTFDTIKKTIDSKFSAEVVQSYKIPECSAYLEEWLDKDDDDDATISEEAAGT